MVPLIPILPFQPKFSMKSLLLTFFSLIHYYLKVQKVYLIEAMYQIITTVLIIDDDGTV